jgi:hypothetical protein
MAPTVTTSLEDRVLRPHRSRFRKSIDILVLVDYTLPSDAELISDTNRAKLIDPDIGRLRINGCNLLLAIVCGGASLIVRLDIKSVSRKSENCSLKLTE